MPDTSQNTADDKRPKFNPALQPLGENAAADEAKVAETTRAETGRIFSEDEVNSWERDLGEDLSPKDKVADEAVRLADQVINNAKITPEEYKQVMFVYFSIERLANDLSKFDLPKDVLKKEFTRRSKEILNTLDKNHLRDAVAINKALYEYADTRPASMSDKALQYAMAKENALRAVQNLTLKQDELLAKAENEGWFEGIDITEGFKEGVQPIDITNADSYKAPQNMLSAEMLKELMALEEMREAGFARLLETAQNERYFEGLAAEKIGSKPLEVKEGKVA